MPKVGRYTAALLLISTGGAVITDKLTGSTWTFKLAEWWPVLFILLGLEYIYFNMRYRENDQRLRLDIGGLLFAVIISMIVVVSTQTTDLFKKFEGFNGLGSIGDVVSTFEGAAGQRFDKGITRIDMPAETEWVKIGNSDGNIVIQPGNVKQIEINWTVYVNVNHEEDAARIAEDTKLGYLMNGSTLDIRTEAKEYSGGFGIKRKPRVEMTITVPAERKASIDVQSTNGKIEASRLPLKAEFKAHTTNGEIRASEMDGRISLETTNGAVLVSKTSGPLSLDTSNGRIELSEHQGDAKLESTNGELIVSRHSGGLDAHTTNGSIKIDGMLKQVKADTTNGSVNITSAKVEGNWKVETTHGTIELDLPKDGNYRVEGEGRHFKNITNKLPLTIEKNNIRGTVGSGTYTIQFETNGEASVQASN